MVSSTIKYIGDASNPERVYYTGSIINNSTITTQQEEDPQIDFKDQRQNAIIPHAVDYELSVENFALHGPQKNLPLFIPQIKSTSVNETQYSVSVGISVGGTKKVGTAFIIWQPENQAPYIQVPPVGANPENYEYYYGYTYSQFVGLVNNALNRAWVLAKDGDTRGTQCPFIEYDESTALFSLNQDSKTCIAPIGTPLPYPWNVTQTFTGDYQNTEFSFVGMNTQLELLLSDFPSVFTSGLTFGTVDLPEVVIDTGLNWNWAANAEYSPTQPSSPVGQILKSLPKSSIVELANPFDGAALGLFFLRIKQDYKSTGSIWSPISSLVLTTGQIPIRNENTANPIILGTGTNGGQSGSSGSFRTILIETPIGDLDADDWRTSLVYNPPNEKFSSFTPSQNPILTIDVKMYWRSRLTNNLIPMTMPNQSSMTFRLLFKKKGLY